MQETVNRKVYLERLAKMDFDCLVVGGGATGAGAALDATLRGLHVALIEKNDFSSGTSSRSTKLIHGGVRYLPQLHFKLIKEALLERKRLLNNAPHLVKPLKFILPCYKFYEKPFYSIGLTIYDILAGDSGLPSHKLVSRDDAIREIPSIQSKDLKGGISYYDSQFNDSRLNVLLARSAAKEGAVVCSRVELVKIIKTHGKISGAELRDLLTNKVFTVKTKVLVNTTGVFIDEVRKLDDETAHPVLSPSQGIHLVFHKDKLKCKTAMIIPKTSDGRVVFVIPWEDHVVVGTTDTPIKEVSIEPLPKEGEVEFLLKTVNEYLNIQLVKSDVKSVFVGLRPLISPDGNTNTKSISREEVILVSDSGLITMSGGKWSTYRKMAEDLVNKIVLSGKLIPHSSCSTYNYSFPGKEDYSENLYLKIAQNYGLNNETARRLRNYYGGEVFTILKEKPVEILKGSGYFQEEVIHAIKNEFALTISDVLARRLRVLFLDLNLAKEMAKPVANILAKQLGWNTKTKALEEKNFLSLVDSLSKSI
ncbi:MAG: FAD-dependent oxidoreductase [Leptospiraceae bacterium]|nr:FAD-dependent oxidoreductase [Leptospiraceae bacterium]